MDGAASEPALLALRSFWLLSTDEFLGSFFDVTHSGIIKQSRPPHRASRLIAARKIDIVELLEGCMEMLAASGFRRYSRSRPR